MGAKPEPGREAMSQEQTGQVFPDKDIDQGVWTRQSPGDAKKRDAPGESEQTETAQVRPSPDRDQQDPGA